MDENQNLQPNDVDVDEWDDVDLTDIMGGNNEADKDNGEVQVQPDADSQADQQAKQADGTGADVSGEPQTQQAEADQSFVLKHLDETRNVNRAEVIELAQKGMDYDRIRESYDAYKGLGDAATLREYKEFLEEMANGKPVSEMMDAIRISALVNQGMDESIAAEKIKLDRDRRAFERERQAAQAKAEESAKAQKEVDDRKKWEQDCISDFAKQFPNVQPKDVPKSVWDAFAKGETLVSAYRGFRMTELEKQLAAKEQAADNASRSVGSRLTSGKVEKEDDSFFVGWDDED